MFDLVNSMNADLLMIAVVMQLRERPPTCVYELDSKDGTKIVCTLDEVVTAYQDGNASVFAELLVRTAAIQAEQPAPDDGLTPPASIFSAKASVEKIAAWLRAGRRPLDTAQATT